jgi:hypothetical protein
MRMTRTTLIVATYVLTCAVAPAQERPDFSGEWTAQPAPIPAFGPQFSMVHKGQSLTLTRAVAGLPLTVNYVLDGVETTSRMPGRLCQPDTGATWTAAWEENAVVLRMTGAIPPNGKPVRMDVRTTLRLESSDTLHVTVASPLPGGQARITESRYKRSADASSAPSEPEPPKARATLADIEWLAGVWIGTTGASVFEERWTTAAGGSMQAVARSLRDGNMNSFEFLCIVERNGGLVYQAMPNGRQPATDFALTAIEPNSFTFENPTHDFPKAIRYTRKPDGTLEAVISGGANQRPQTFVFRRQ